MSRLKLTESRVVPGAGLQAFFATYFGADWYSNADYYETVVADYLHDQGEGGDKDGQVLLGEIDELLTGKPSESTLDELARMTWKPNGEPLPGETWSKVLDDIRSALIKLKAIK